MQSSPFIQVIGNEVWCNYVKVATLTDEASHCAKDLFLACLETITENNRE